MSNKLLDLIQSSNAKWVDFRFTDTRGKEQHISFPAHTVDEDVMEDGKMFDGSSIAGWKGIEASDMILRPDPETAFVDPFFDAVTVVVTCDIIEPSTLQGYDRDPRSIARRAEEYLKSTGIGDTAYFGPEPEFFVFDDVKWSVDMSGVSHKITAEEAAWSTNETYEWGNMAHRPRVKGGYFPVPPIDSSHDMRAVMCERIEEIVGEGSVEVHHHEVASCQSEIGVAFNTMVRKADEVQQLKYVVHNVAHQFGKTATFMPKPIVGDNGSGMHVHMSISKDGVNTFSGDEYAGLSETALYFIGGIIKHARALNAITNPSTNSYKRLVPHYEAPIKLAYSASNRSASIRIPHVSSPKAVRVEARFPDPTANPYLAFAALLMAGLDGIQNKMHPGEAADKNLYDLPPEEEAQIPTVAESLDVALQALRDDHDFLLKGDVFTEDMLEAFIALKEEEVQRLNVTVHPVEFDMYYSC
ncbi:MULTISPECIES: type I glutamate--ammonia ligase [Psychrobacter]|jgi:glutamine synthetase|uniref:Glutamine synthetase n=1 Tax=Psychrobacter nivimaris TaxID=281738 RepID=A0A6N7C0G8_9GAMM|nr:MULTISPECIES: type I glutamate--ammonia ligase [Psychrobacter]UVI02245.1 type I glutamate-ammonia ligase [Psychrobacter aquimaris]KAF0568270.1 Glutamine synthetase type I [Psychrobacter nivimaris]KRG36925.1 glutamine synthetase [Psychrobacter sp. P11G3]MBA6243129.1 type I glutamate--ammonia ligase [Psychrobacter sp. Urea-trap-18]MBA6286187.1 type I glutamate--ammonia ligase [Psychrobacter sp. Urea-trap-16]|tara:strand:+ start:23825 stop:25234 length:1410 start_codon:yes stop_codon:yes gene_type:complete